MPDRKGKAKRNHNRRLIATALRRAGGKTTAVDCKWCGSKVGISVVPMLRGVEADFEKMIPTKMAKAEPSPFWVCINENCARAISTESLNDNVREIHRQRMAIGEYKLVPDTDGKIRFRRFDKGGSV